MLHLPLHAWPPGTILTHSGRAVNLLAPSPEAVDLGDICHALANECRFSGHTRNHYSVAEHLLYGLTQLPKHDHLLRLQWLLHDAAEAYVKDLPRPLKRLPGYDHYCALEEEWQGAIAERFGIGVHGVYPPAVRELDNRMLVTEFQQLMGRAPHHNDAYLPLPLCLDQVETHEFWERSLRNAIAHELAHLRAEQVIAEQNALRITEVADATA